MHFNIFTFQCDFIVFSDLLKSSSNHVNVAYNEHMLTLTFESLLHASLTLRVSLLRSIISIHIFYSSFI